LNGATDVDVCNRAIGRVGGEPIESLDDETPLAAFAPSSGRPQGLAAGLLPLGVRRPRSPSWCSWPSPRPTAPCPSPTPGPADLAGAIHAFRNGPDACGRAGRADQLADYIASDTLLWAEYTAAVDPATWPPWFKELAVKSFAADVARRRAAETLADEPELEAFGPPEMNGQGGLMLQAMQGQPQRPAAQPGLRRRRRPGGRPDGGRRRPRRSAASPAGRTTASPSWSR
jgi:hypothetical protein